MTDYQVTVEWTAKGAFGTPSTTKASKISWDSKSEFDTPTRALSGTIEWTAKSSFTPPHAFKFIDLR